VPSDEDISSEVSGDTHELRLYKRDDLIYAITGLTMDEYRKRIEAGENLTLSPDDTRALQLQKMRCRTMATTQHWGRAFLKKSSGQKEFARAAYRLLDAYSDPDTYVVGYYNKETRWLDHIVVHRNTTFPL